MILALLATAGAQEPVEIDVWHAYRGQERAALEQLLSEYDAAHPELVVVPLALPSDSFTNKLEAAAPRGNGPDVFIAAGERIGDWSATGLVLPVDLDPSVYHPITLSGLTYQDRVWGVPMTAKTLALFYRPGMVSSPPETTDELVEVARDLTGDGVFGLAYEAASPYFNAAWLHGYGGGVFDGDHVDLSQPENAAALAFVVQLAVDEGVVPQEPTFAVVSELFNDDRAAMVISGPWFLGQADVDFAVAPLPVVSETGLRAAPYVTVEAAFVSGFSEHPELSQELAQWLASDHGARTRAVEGRQIVATLSAYEDPRVAEDPVLSAFRAQLDHAVPMPTVPEMGSTWEPLARATRRSLRKDMSPQAALDLAQIEFDKLTAPPPPPVDWRPYAAVLAMALLGGMGWFGHQAWSRRRDIKAWGFAYLYVGPAAVAMTLLVFLPFVVGAGVSLFAHHQGDFTFVGLSHYLDIALARDYPIFSPQSFWFTLAVTMLWTVANVVLHVGIGVGLAMLLREKWVKLRAMWRVLLILPWAIPNYITALIWKGMFHRQFGAINGLLAALGAEPVSWFGGFWTAFAANLTTNTWLGFPFMMVVTLGALQSIPRDLEAAAEVDGASGWQRFRHITLPLLKPALLPAVILGSVWTFNMFNVIYLVSGGEPDGSTEILISEAYRWAFDRQHQYGYASAYAVLIFGVLWIYSRVANRLAGAKVL